MTSPKIPTLILGCAALALAACGSRTLDPGGDGGGGTAGAGGGAGDGPGGTTGTGGCIAARLSPAGTVPPEHRASSTMCSASKAPPLDGGPMSCTSTIDCVGDGGLVSYGYDTCLHGVCSFDQCLTDADCGAGGVCACSTDYYGGNAAYHANICVTGNCRVDADCGAGGYCSPSRGYCGTVQGFYCHGPSDSCVDPKVDCALCGNACLYAPTANAFVCGAAICAG